MTVMASQRVASRAVAGCGLCSAALAGAWRAAAMQRRGPWRWRTSGWRRGGGIDCIGHPPSSVIAASAHVFHSTLLGFLCIGWRVLANFVLDKGGQSPVWPPLGSVREDRMAQVKSPPMVYPWSTLYEESLFVFSLNMNKDVFHSLLFYVL
jgi:hypothetical protein